MKSVKKMKKMCIWEDHMVSTVVGELEEKVVTAQKGTAFSWGEMRETLN